MVVTTPARTNPARTKLVRAGVVPCLQDEQHLRDHFCPILDPAVDRHSKVYLAIKKQDILIWQGQDVELRRKDAI